MAGKSKKDNHPFIQRLLEEMGFSNLSELARASSVPLQTLRAWSYGIHTPGRSLSAQQFADFLHIDLEMLNEQFALARVG